MFALGFDLNANLAAILTLITALATALVTVINAIKNKQKFKEADVKLDDQTSKLDVIHKQTNGTLSNLKEEIAVLKAENNKLEEINRRLTQDRRAKIINK